MQKNFTITVNCLVKNEESFVGYGIKSVIDYVDRVIVFDTGSTDKTVEIIDSLIKQYPDKIYFEEKGPCDKKRHTQLRHEMLAKTNSDWMMLLDGDEVWTKKAMEEAIEVINKNKDRLDFISAEVYLCVGDIFHDHNRGLIERVSGELNLALGRFFRFRPGMGWTGDYGVDYINNNGQPIKENTVMLKNKFWHLTHLRRSSTDDNDYTSNTSAETRKKKRRTTYFIIGKKIAEPVPEVFDEEFQVKNRIGFLRSFVNFWPYLLRRVWYKIIARNS